jgi:hypothetical protein
LNGRFCANCGQRADIHVPTTHELVHDALEGLTHSDSRLWRTLGLLWLKPGRLTREFIAGRRESYLPPFRLYLVISVILFLFASFLRPSETGEIVHVDSKDLATGASPETICDKIHVQFFGTANPVLDQRFHHGCVTTVRDHGESFLHVVFSTLPKAMFIFLPLIAFLHMLVYWWPRQRYAVHLLFFIHLHAFFFSVIALLLVLHGAAVLWPALASTVRLLTQAAAWAAAVYTVFAMKRVFERGWANTLCKAAGLFIVYSGVLGITIGLVFVYAVMQV